MGNIIIRISSPDRTGLVALFSGVVANIGANILDARHHKENGTFFQRFEIESASSKAQTELERELLRACDKVGGTCEVRYHDQPQRIALFVSKADHCLYELLLEHRHGRLGGDIVVVVSNHPDLGHVAQHFGIPFVHIPVTKENKADAEAQQLELLSEFRVDLVVLARYMQVLSSDFVKAYPQRIINVHHAFLPAFPGRDPYGQAFARGVKAIGATAHFVTSELDEGPYIQQVTAPCTHKDTVDDLRYMGQELERKVLAQAVRAFLEGRLFVCGLRVVEL